MYQLHIAHKNYSSWSLRPWILLTELQIPFQEHVHLFSEDNWDEFRSFSPSGKVPCLVTDDIPVWDSLAITEFLAERHPGVWAADPVARAWSRCAASEMHSGFGSLREICSMNCSVRYQLHEIPASLQKDISRIDELWHEGMSRFGGPFLAGADFTAVDAFFAPVAFRIHNYGLSLSAPSMAYVARLLDLPGMQAWAQAALLEPREEQHEQYCLQYASVLSDARHTAA